MPVPKLSYIMNLIIPRIISKIPETIDHIFDGNLEKV